MPSSVHGQARANPQSVALSVVAVGKAARAEAYKSAIHEDKSLSTTN